MIDRRRLLAGLGSGMVGLPGLARAASLVPSDDAVLAALLYGYGPYEFARAAQRLSSARTPDEALRVNRITHRRTLADHGSRQVTAPNNDTVYSSAFLDLAPGPVLLDAPTDRQRYFSIAFMDLFTDNFAYIGTRATGGEGGRFLVTGPSFKGKAPPHARVIRAPTNDVWMLARILVSGPEDLPGAVRLQDQIRLTPMGAGPGTTFNAPQISGPLGPAPFLALVNEALGRSPGSGAQLPRARRFAGQGIRPGQADAWGSLPETTRTAWERAMPDGMALIRRSFITPDRAVNGWALPPPELGNFGTNDLKRAAVALGGLAALELKEAMYLSSLSDSAGEPLSGERRYRWTVPPGGVPARAFWSLTMYQAEPDGRYFYTANSLGRYSIGDRTRGLERDADGSIVVQVSRDPPPGGPSNWLPAPPGPMRLSLRAYIPEAELLEGRWRPPPIERV
jgi:hypothetical protein